MFSDRLLLILLSEYNFRIWSWWKKSSQWLRRQRTLNIDLNEKNGLFLNFQFIRILVQRSKQFYRSQLVFQFFHNCTLFTYENDGRSQASRYWRVWLLRQFNISRTVKNVGQSDCKIRNRRNRRKEFSTGNCCTKSIFPNQTLKKNSTV